MEVSSKVAYGGSANPSNMRMAMRSAIKFTQNGGAIQVVTEPVEEKIVRVTVRDNGSGIPEDKLDTIFESFHQLDGASTRKHGGTGLGLSLARNIIEAHDTKIIVRSKVGEGSQFMFDLRAT